jgi:hypothetical protein
MTPFLGASSSFASAFNLATTLFHFHEWLFDQYKPQLEQNFNITIAKFIYRVCLSTVRAVSSNKQKAGLRSHQS